MQVGEMSSARDDVTVRNWPSATGVPLCVFPSTPSASAQSLLPRLRMIADEHIEKCGAILLRGFSFDGIDGFRAVAAALGGDLLSYEFGSTPRRRVTEGVYTSTEYPAHQSIPLHNEMSYTRAWPMRIWFFCVTACEQGGATPIGDSRVIYQRIESGVRRRFEERKLMYVRNFGNGLDVPWAQAFETEDRGLVERYCRDHGIVCEWRRDGGLRTRQVCQAVAKHPRTGDVVWFNQAHLFHVSALDVETRETLLEVVGPADLPRNVYYGDGSSIEDAVLDEIRGVLDEVQVEFPWQSGDVLMLDNMLTAHGRTPFDGPRKVIVAMADGHRE